MDPDDLVLVAIVKARRDLEIARMLGWYRIPLQSAPKTVRVDWLAFYQTGAFGDERWSVRYVAPVRGFELTTRSDLLRDEPDHPRADEPYYRIQIGELERLPSPDPERRMEALHVSVHHRQASFAGKDFGGPDRPSLRRSGPALATVGRKGGY